MSETKDNSQQRFERVKTRVLAALEKGQTQQALSLLQVHLAEFSHLKEYYGLFVQALLQKGKQQEADLFLTVIEKFDQAEPLYKVGCFFMDQKLTWLAIPILKRAHDLNPHNPEVIHELAIAYGYEGYHREAFDILDKHPRDDEYWIRFERGWNALHVGKIEEAQKNLDWLREKVDQAPAEQRLAALYSLRRLAYSLQRYQSAGDPGEDLRKWHYITYGAAFIEHVGVDFYLQASEDELAPSMGTFGQTLEKGASWLRKISPSVERIYWFSDIDSQITGQMLSLLLEIPGEKLPSRSPEETSHSIVVAGQSTDFNPSFREIYPGQTLLSVHLRQHQSIPICPDLALFFTKEDFFFPWEKSENPDQEAHLVATGLEERGGTWLKELLETTEKDQSSFSHLDFYQSQRSLLTAGNAESYPFGRLSYSGESPIPMLKVF